LVVHPFDVVKTRLRGVSSLEHLEISWHDRAGAIGYDYGRGNQCLPRFNILRVPCGKCL